MKALNKFDENLNTFAMTPDVFCCVQTIFWAVAMRLENSWPEVRQKLKRDAGCNNLTERKVYL